MGGKLGMRLGKGISHNKLTKTGREKQIKEISSLNQQVEEISSLKEQSAELIELVKEAYHFNRLGIKNIKHTTGRWANFLKNLQACIEKLEEESKT